MHIRSLKHPGIVFTVALFLGLSSLPSFAEDASSATDASPMERTKVRIVTDEELSDNRDVIVIVRFKLTREGTIEGTPAVSGQGRNADIVAKAKERALQAVLRSQPFKLPPEKYDLWSNVELTFHAE
ncbi:hypothetical protein [Phyllobacterium myrsinacearum]|uniref:Energy transducer TonB n=1 Tax=Phyllobacterium myrsinacearum TaxID=28101 RepID=A0A839EBX9_9HYPH|nr:hypothetical protein [Phyllobacterium myrsinacearum]MBA8876462.1 hypothetical protein [Phyllobacterium myrsinacearum]